MVAGARVEEGFKGDLQQSLEGAMEVPTAERYLCCQEVREDGQIFPGGLPSDDRKEFADGVAVGKNWHGPTTMVRERHVPVDAEVSVDGRPEIVGGQGPFARFFTFGIGGTDDLSGSHPTPGNQHGHGLRPVISTGLGHACLRALLGIDAGGAAEFSGDDEQNFAIKPFVVEVFDKCGNGLVVDWEANASVFKQVAIDGV